MSEARAPSARGLRPAAQYLRMSTDKQAYSIHFQSVAIAAYAAERDYEVVKTYSDPGISGLGLERRDGLRALLADVVAGHADYEAVLVYDVSRWGRFQDPDESAHYEFLCREAGIAVEYCAEPFDNDASLTSVLMKHLKRAMAAEYSRELSQRVRRAKRDIVRLGFSPGGPAPFGYGRQLVDEQGRAVRRLAPGERKTLQGERVVFVLGDPAEIDAVRRIFRLFVVAGLRRSMIARQLNGERAPAPTPCGWTADSVTRLLREERYAGVMAYGRRRCPLGGPWAWGDPAEVVRVEGAYPAIVSEALFVAAQANLRRNWRRGARQEALRRLRELHAEHGGISQALIAAAPGLPPPRSYSRWFGSLREALRLAMALEG